MPKICPLRMLAQESDWDTINNCGTDCNYSFSSETACLEEACAWWNYDFGECAIMALATVVTRPVVLKERLGNA
jgi:hypothetical protein